MDSRERLQRIIGGEAADRCGFWLGMPHPDTVPGYLKHFGAADLEAIRLRLKDDYRWICPQFFPNAYRHPHEKPMWPPMLGPEHGKVYPLAEVETADEVHAAEWPNPDYLDFTDGLAALDKAGPYYRASGMWCSFYHGIMDLLGMENYMIKMYTHPEVLDAVTDRVCSFYYEANERFFEKAGRRVDGFFFGNDFGTQLDLICSPAHFDRYIMPWFRKFTEQGHRWGYQVILHSCGAIHKVIERLIASGVEALHPLQARAANMEAEALARDFKGRIAFVGGIDTQELLVHGTPEEVKADVRRVKALLGPRLVVSPSHEALLPNVSPENVIAMAEAAVE